MSPLSGRKRRGTLVTLTAAVLAGVAVLGASGANEAKPLKVGAALIGPKNDKSFDQAAYEGILAAVKQHPGKLKLTSVLESRATDAERTAAVETLAPLDDMVVTISSSFGPILDLEAPKFPQTHFIDVAGYPAHYHANVTAFANDYGAPLFVAGVVAAHLTKSKVVGFVGGAEIPASVQGLEGYKAGVAFVNPKIKVLSNFVGDFNDVEKARAATSAMISDKADVIFPFVNGGLPGAWSAGKDSGKNPAMFSEVVPDCGAYPNMVGTNLVNNKAVVARLLNQYVRGTLQAGTIFLDLQAPKIQTLQLCPKYRKNKAIAAVVKRTIAGVNSGRIKLPKSAMNPRPAYAHREGFTGKVHGTTSG